MLKYADDIRIYREFKSDKFSQQENHIKFQADIDALNSWSQVWDLQFNASKCCVLHFGYANEQNSYKINDTILQNKVIEKDLGVHFHSNLKFNEHIDSVVVKENKQLGIILWPLGNSGPWGITCLLYTSPSPRDLSTARMPSSA